MKEEEMGVYNSLLTKSEYDLFKFREVLKESKEYLLKLDSKKRLEIIRELLKNPNFNDTDVYYLAMIEIQEDPSYKPPCIEPKKPSLYKIRFVMSGRQPTKPIWEEKKAAKRNEKLGRKRLRSNSDCEFDEEEEKARAIKNRAIKKNMNEKENENEVVLPENRRGLPAEFKERIQNLGGNKATLVIQKDLFATDVSTGHARLSIPWTQIKDKGFLSEQEKAFLAPRENGSSVGR